MGLITYTSKIRPIIEYSSSVWGDSSPVLGGLSGYLQDEIERVQSRSLGMLGLDRNYIPSLSSRRELATIREVKTIQADLNHPCHNLLPEPTDHSYDLRQTNGCRFAILSRTERHKLSFIARSCKYL